MSTQPLHLGHAPFSMTFLDISYVTTTSSLESHYFVGESTYLSTPLSRSTSALSAGSQPSTPALASR